MMTVYDFCFLCTEPRLTDVQIYDLSDKCEAPGSIVFQGSMEEASLSKYGSYEVYSFDLDENGMTINIDTSDN